jgi:hypothetical protein
MGAAWKKHLLPVDLTLAETNHSLYLVEKSGKQPLESSFKLRVATVRYEFAWTSPMCEASASQFPVSSWIMHKESIHTHGMSNSLAMFTASRNILGSSESEILSPSAVKFAHVRVRFVEH